MANLTQLKMLESLDAVLPVDKPQGIPFATAVKAVKRRFGLVKVGHGGSLDAMASGLLVLLINGANRFAADVMGADRAYEGELRLGRRTDTHDCHGRVLEELLPEGASAPADLAERLTAALPAFKGDIFQTESRFCSVRREGSAGYDVADTGEHGQTLSHVYRLSFAERPDGLRLGFKVVGTKGLIVRTLVNDLGDALGCGATLETLRRTRVGRFELADAIAFDRLLETDPADFAALTVPMSVAFKR